MFGRDLLLPNLANYVSKTATSKIMMPIPNKEILRYVGMAVYVFSNHGIPKWLQSIMLLSVKIIIVGNGSTSYLFQYIIVLHKSFKHHMYIHILIS